ncbi:MAG TPA: TetR/AcrR family transcriptional regulator [Kofleriaceae bacterium]|nr:TetR/AcrR family transcriptional regulator [Kofleriaceae bacterium]
MPRAHPQDARPSRDERRLTLVDAAKRCFASRGYHATTVDDITRAAGVAKGTFYLYFDEKREIYYEVIRTFMQLIKDIGSSIAATSSDPRDLFARAERAARELMQVFLDNRELARLAYRESMGLDPELERMIAHFYREIAQVAARNIEVAIELGLIRRVDPLITAYAHIGMVERVLMAMVDDPDRFDPDRVVAELMRLSWEGLAAASAGPSSSR